MSRCLPFSPEAFSRRRSSHEALIKPQKEKEKIKTVRRSEMELKRKSRKVCTDKPEKRPKCVTGYKVTKLPDQKYHQETKKVKAELNQQFPSKGIVDESENSETSGLTEEFEPPTHSGSICNVPDRTVNTNKRKRQDDSVDGIERKRLIFRIRLPLKKDIAPDVSPIEPDNNCSSKRSVICSASVEVEQPSTIPCLDLPLPASETKTSCAQKSNLSVDDLQKKSVKKPAKKSTYEMLIEDWVPPGCCLQSGQIDYDDEDWLFGSRKKHEQGSQRHHQAGHDKVVSSSWPPQAKYSSEVDVYVLPYTVSF